MSSLMSDKSGSDEFFKVLETQDITAAKVFPQIFFVYHLVGFALTHRNSCLLAFALYVAKTSYVSLAVTQRKVIFLIWETKSGAVQKPGRKAEYGNIQSLISQSKHRRSVVCYHLEFHLFFLCFFREFQICFPRNEASSQFEIIIACHHL